MGRRIRTIFPISNIKLLSKVIQKTDLQRKEERKIEKQITVESWNSESIRTRERTRSLDNWRERDRKNSISFFLPCSIRKENLKGNVLLKYLEHESKPDEVLNIPPYHPRNMSPKSNSYVKPITKSYVTRIDSTVQPPQKLDLWFWKKGRCVEM